ncbi:terpenoid synthase [Parathielavia appendiculata]|uniref:Terpene synthase n=1 Tax=Parathielavia appendiculata TaxID=2587402 RepID=A0AAN6Z7C0_9PEZI|nr:terpenoid synthase [Parathielavia appendiculata]
MCSCVLWRAKCLRGQRLHIPNLWPAFASWKQGVNPCHGQVKQAVDGRLEGLIDHEKVLAKVKAADLGLFASGVFSEAPYERLETVAFYCVWLFLWDDVIDGAGASEDSGLAAEEYCQQSVDFVRFCLGLDDGQAGRAAPEAPTKVCGSFAEVGRRLRECCGLDQRSLLFKHLREYMEGCVTEYKWRVSGKVPSVEDFYSWRLKTSSVDVMLVLCKILNGISLWSEILESEEFAAMGLSVNKLLILINELFSLKKELDGAFSNLIPIIMRSLGSGLEGATNSMVRDIYDCIKCFDSNASALQAMVTAEGRPDTAAQVKRLIEAYQSIATSVLNFSIHSPRYGLLKDMREDGSFVVVL